MQAIIELPDSLYRRSEVLAASRGASVEQFIVEAVTKEVQESLRSGNSDSANVRKGALPVIPSARPGTMDPSGFDFDDLLT